MSLFATDRPPDHINEQGSKFWLDKSLTQYARDPGRLGVSLNAVTALIVTDPQGITTRLLMEGQDVLAEDQSLESIACRIDMLKLARQERT